MAAAARGSDATGALCEHDPVRIEGAAGGELPLAGVEFVAKDVFALAGSRCCAGNPDWLASHGPAVATAPAVERLLAAGATLVGKALCDELTYSITGRNFHYGTPLNARAPDRIPGGSSSGSASAVGRGLVPLALGTDTTGSIRTPAALCGVWGMRPGHGEVPSEGVVPLAPSFDTAGALAADAALLGAAMAALLGRDGEAAGAPRLRRALLAGDAWALADEEVRTALAPARERLRERLPSEELTLAPDGLAAWAKAVRIQQAREIWSVHGEWVERARPRFGPGVAERFEAARAVGAEEDARAGEARTRAGARVRELVGADGVLVLPTCPTPAPPVSAPEQELGAWRGRVMALTAAANVSGLPEVAIPCGTVAGGPVSLGLVGPPGSEPALIELGAALAG